MILRFLLGILIRHRISIYSRTVFISLIEKVFELFFRPLTFVYSEYQESLLPRGLNVSIGQDSVTTRL